MKCSRLLHFVLTICATTITSAPTFAADAPRRNVILFIADGLRPGSVNPTDAPTLWSIRQNGVNFVNSHALFPTFTAPNASAIATGHYLGDTGDFSNAIYMKPARKWVGGSRAAKRSASSGVYGYHPQLHLPRRTAQDSGAG